MQTPDVTGVAAPTIAETLAKFEADGWLVPPLSWRIIGFVWAYNIVWMIVQDVVKLGLYHILDPTHSWKRSLFERLRTGLQPSNRL